MKSFKIALAMTALVAATLPAKAQDRLGSNRVVSIYCSANQAVFNGSLGDGVGTLQLDFRRGVLTKPASAGGIAFGDCYAYRENGRELYLGNIFEYNHNAQRYRLPGAHWDQVSAANMTIIGVGRYGINPHVGGFARFPSPFPTQGFVDRRAGTVTLGFDDRAYGHGVAVDLVIELRYDGSRR